MNSTIIRNSPSLFCAEVAVLTMLSSAALAVPANAAMRMMPRAWLRSVRRSFSSGAERARRSVTLRSSSQCGLARFDAGEDHVRRVLFERHAQRDDFAIGVAIELRG